MWVPWVKSTALDRQNVRSFKKWPATDSDPKMLQKLDCVSLNVANRDFESIMPEDRNRWFASRFLID